MTHLLTSGLKKRMTWHYFNNSITDKGCTQYYSSKCILWKKRCTPGARIYPMLVMKSTPENMA